MIGFNLHLTNVPVASVDREAGIVLTMDGLQLPVTGWADEDGVLRDFAANARFCSAGPDAYGLFWLVNIDRRLARIPLMSEAVLPRATPGREAQAGAKPACTPNSPPAPHAGDEPAPAALNQPAPETPHA